MSKLEIKQQSQIWINGSHCDTVDGSFRRSGDKKEHLGWFFSTRRKWDNLPTLLSLTLQIGLPKRKKIVSQPAFFFSGKLFVLESLTGLALVVWCFGRIFPNTFRLSLIQAQPGCSQVQRFLNFTPGWLFW